MSHLVVLVLFGEVTSTLSFSVTSLKPENGSTSVQQGFSLELWCNVDGYWEFCSFSHVPSGKSCDFQWKRDIYNVTVTNCTSFEGRFEYLGDFEKYECGIRIHQVGYDESGNWTCDMESYTRYEGVRGNGYQVIKSFEVEVTPNVINITIGVTISLLLIAIFVFLIYLKKKKNVTLLQCHEKRFRPRQRNENHEIATVPMQVCAQLIIYFWVGNI